MAFYSVLEGKEKEKSATEAWQWAGCALSLRVRVAVEWVRGGSANRELKIRREGSTDLRMIRYDTSHSP